jgi:transposase InsO family protein
MGRFRDGGYEAIAPRSRAPGHVPHRTPDATEDAIVALRKELGDRGLDAGALTIHYHLSLTGEQVPSVSTIWRVLRRRGFVIPQPHKRPRSSWVRFEAQLPNECWQSDVTHWRLADGIEVEIVNFIDDHSRLAVASHVLARATAPAVLRVFQAAAATWGFPAALLTDNGCVYTTWHRGGPNVMQTELLALGIDYRHSRPYHPQTCGKGRALPPDDEGVPGQAGSRDLDRGSSDPGRSVRRVLQRGAAPPCLRQTATADRVRCPGQGAT